MGFPILVFLLTSAEMSLLIFFQFSLGFSLEYSIEKFSLFICIICVLYIIGVIVWLFNKIIIQDCLNTMMGKREFYFINLILDAKTTMKKLFLFIFLARKIISSAILVYLFSDVVVQITLLTFVYAIFWVYIIAFRPFK